MGPPIGPAMTFLTGSTLRSNPANKPTRRGLGSLAPCAEGVGLLGTRPRKCRFSARYVTALAYLAFLRRTVWGTRPPHGAPCGRTESHLPWDPDPPATFDVVGVLDPGVGVVYPLPLILVAVDPLGELGKRVAPLHVVVEPTVRESQPLARADQVRVGAYRPAVGQPNSAPPALSPTSVPPPGDTREGVPRLHVVQEVPLSSTCQRSCSLCPRVLFSGQSVLLLSH